VATVVRSEMLLDPGFTRSSAGPSPDIMALRGRRIVFASENEEHAKMSTSRVKWLTGGDEITARNPFDKFDVTFQPTHNLFLLTNHKPHVSADDFAFWERVLLITFNVAYVMRKPSAPNERPADPRLGQKLLAESDGILAWMVRGCLQWQERGLDPPPAVSAAVAQYRRDEDIIGDFIEECLLLAPDDQAGVPARDVYDVFAWWWARNVTKNPPKQKWLGNLLGRRFRREKVGTYRYFGFTIAPDTLMDMESGQSSMP
jgi:putative DNA primase/helicase